MLFVRWMLGFVAACALASCGGEVAGDATQPTDAGQSPGEDATTTGDTAVVSPCSVICAGAHGACPADCEAQCATYLTSDPCGTDRIALWACAAKQGKAYCTGAGALYVTSPTLEPGECDAEADAAKACACKTGGLLCDQ
jgi:hypothetical protein